MDPFHDVQAPAKPNLLLLEVRRLWLLPSIVATSVWLWSDFLATRKASLDAKWWAHQPPALVRHWRPSLAYRFCLVAEGRFDAVLTIKDAWEWDIAAGILIATEAGAAVSDRDGAIIGCYSTLSPQDWWEVDFFWLVGDASSDDAFKGNNNEGDQRDFGNLADFNINSSNEWVEYKWRFSYQGIYRCNLAIERIPTAPILQEEIDELVAEAKHIFT